MSGEQCEAPEAAEPECLLSNPLEHEACKEFAERKCTSLDLLVVSRATAQHPTYAVGACLGNLVDSEIKAVRHDPEIPIRCDKAYQLLFNWKLKASDRATWAHLVDCVKVLDDDTIMRRIKYHLQRINEPSEGVIASTLSRSVASNLEAISGEAFNQLDNSSCTDIDMRCVSVKAARHSVAVIAACLLLEDDLVARITCEEFPSRQRKIYQLFIEWGRQRSSVRPTWSTLCGCLAYLEDAPLMEGVKDYLTDKLFCSEISKLKLQVHIIQPQQETDPQQLETGPHMSALVDTSHAFTTFSSPTPTFAGDHEDEFAPASTLSLEESSFDRNRALMVPFPVESDHPVSPEFNEEVAALESEFSYLHSMVYQNLKEKKVPVDTVQQFINSLSVSRTENIPLFNQHMQEIISSSSLEEVFGILTRIGVWSFLNFRILEEIMRWFGGDELNVKIEQYKEKIRKFKSKTKLSDFLQVWSGRRFHTSSQDPEGIQIIAKCKGVWRYCTLSEVATMEQYLANEFLLHRSIFRLANAKPGCVTIMWLVPLSALKAIKKVIKERQPDLKKANIQELTVGNLLFVQDGESVEPLSYQHLYKYSIEHPEKFWGDRARKLLVWDKPFTKVMERDRTKWFTGGTLNVTQSVLDRHVEEDPERIALIWEPNEPGTNPRVTYRELYEMTCRVANVLKSNNIAKGDVVTIYMPIMPLTVACMLACARIGAIHSVVFPALKGHQLKRRIQRAKSEAVITVTSAKIGEKELQLKANIDEVITINDVKHVFVASSPESQLKKLTKPLTATNEDPSMQPVTLNGWDIDLEEEMAKASPTCAPLPMDSEDSLFLMFTSGTTSEPKIITHSQAGYLLYAAVTHKYVFDYQPGDVFACMADLGWITGHSYVVYGPLCNGATTVLFGSTATYPDAGRYWAMVERLKINQFYTSASAIKGLMKTGEGYVRRYDLSSLRTIGSVGEHLNKDMWKWYHNVVGRMRCVLVDTWWQTEIGGIAITPLPVHESCQPKPGFTMKPFFGVQPVITNEQMEEVGYNHEGHLCLKAALPGMGREVNRKREEFQTTYFENGLYNTSDWACCDSDGDFRIVCRASDTIRIQGVWLDVQEIERLMADSDVRVKEACLVGYNRTGSQDQKTFAFVELEKGVGKEVKEVVIKRIKKKVKREAEGASGHCIAVPEKFVFLDKQPKTHSGKSVRYLLRNIASKVESGSMNCPVGDTNTREYLYRDDILTLDPVNYEDRHEDVYID